MQTLRFGRRMSSRLDPSPILSESGCTGGRERGIGLGNQGVEAEEERGGNRQVTNLHKLQMFLEATQPSILCAHAWASVG